MAAVDERVVLSLLQRHRDDPNTITRRRWYGWRLDRPTPQVLLVELRHGGHDNEQPAAVDVLQSLQRYMAVWSQTLPPTC